MTGEREPRTEAGRALRRAVQDLLAREWTPEADAEFGARIRAIEDEAAGEREAGVLRSELDVERLAWAILAARSTTGQWKGNARATEPTQWDRIMAKRAAAAYNEGAGTSSESNRLPDPARPLASTKSDGSVDSRRY